MQKRRTTSIYCKTGYHSTNKCTRVLDVTSRRDIPSKKGICFNFASAEHQISYCKSRPYFKCGQKHHASICESTWLSIDQLSTANESSQDKMKQEAKAQEQPTERSISIMTESSNTIHPTLLATVATSSYVCTDLITKLGIKPVRREQHCTEQMYGTLMKAVKVYNITIKSSVIEEFRLKVDCINTEKNVLTHVQNQKVIIIKNQNPRIRGLRFLEEGKTQDLLPVQTMLSVANYQRIRTNELPVLGLNTNINPVAEFTKLRWMLCGGNHKENTIWETVICKWWKVRVSEVVFIWCTRSRRCQATWRIQPSKVQESYQAFIIDKRGTTRLHYHGNRIIHLYLATNCWPKREFGPLQKG